jgi:iron complex outermembrane receptor protein
MLRLLLLLFGTALYAPSGQKQQGQSGPTSDLTVLSLEELMQLEVQPVRGASLKLETTAEAPSAVTVVTREEILSLQVRTLGDLLANVTGFYVTDDRNYVRLGVRGFQLPGDFNTRILLLVDGHRLNDMVYGSAPVGREFPIDVDLIERVEIIRGPGSALYGSSAIFAVVNVITREPTAVGGVEAAVHAGTFDAYELRTTVSGGDERASWIASLSGFDAAGGTHVYPDYAGEPGGGFTSGTDYESAYQAFFGYRAGEWSLQSAYGWREKGIPTGSYGTVFDDPENRTTDAFGYLDLAWRRELAEGREVAARLTYDHYDYRGWYIYDDTAFGGPPDLLNVDQSGAHAIGLEAHAGVRLDERHELTFGAEVLRTLDTWQENYDDVYGSYLDESRSAWRAGAFVQDEIALRDDLSLVAGARYDRYDTFGGAFNPRLALVYAASEHHVWKLLAGTAFRAPNEYELFYEDGYAQKANPDLDPERITTLEGVWEGDLGGGFRARTSAYHYRIRDLIAQEVDPLDDLLVFRNTDRVDASGLEIETSKVFAGGRRLRLAQNLVDVEVHETGDTLPNSPRYWAQAGLRQPLFRGAAGLDVAARYLGARDTVSGGTAPSYVVVDVALRLPRLWDHLELSLAVRNVLDRSYSDPVGSELVQDALEQDGRTFLFGVTYRP